MRVYVNSRELIHCGGRWNLGEGVEGREESLRRCVGEGLLVQRLGRLSQDAGGRVHRRWFVVGYVYQATGIP